VVCTDKTGTLTAGEMTVTTLWIGGAAIEVTGRGYAPEGGLLREGRPLAPPERERVEAALRVGLLANRAELERTDGGWRIRGDPTEAALLVTGRKAGLDRERLTAEWPEVGEVPFSSERRLMATFHRPASGGLVACVKGAPGRTLELCSRALGDRGEEPLDAAGRDAIRGINEAMGARGLRVLALATGRVSEAAEPALRDLLFLGLVGMIDPAAEGVEPTIRRLSEAGIRTVMITGDQQATAEAIARELGILREGDEVLGGREFERLSEAELARRVERVGAFSRVSPEAKLRIVSALKANGEITAMLGDGVNDAAALKRADVGVAMGIRGTDVAKEAAALVLQDDRFPTIAAAVEEGRVIFDNIRKFVFYLFSCNLAEVVVLLTAALAGLPLPLLPLQILWLNLVTDTFPALALALEPAEADIMRRPPRSPQKAILSRGFLTAIAFYALLITAATMAAFLWGLSRGPQERASTLAFQTLALAQAFHLGNARSSGTVMRIERVRANPWALGAVALVVGLQVLAVEFPPLARTLGVVPLTATEWVVVAALTALPALIGQAVKGRRREGRGRGGR
jgi:Ca2+-transporting ATPase